MASGTALSFILLLGAAWSSLDLKIEKALEIWTKPQYCRPDQIWLRKQAELYFGIFETIPGLTDEERDNAGSAFINFVSRAMFELEPRPTYRLATAIENSRRRRESGSNRPEELREGEANPAKEYDYDMLMIDLHLDSRREVPEVDLLGFPGLLPDSSRQQAIWNSLGVLSRYRILESEDTVTESFLISFIRKDTPTSVLTRQAATLLKLQHTLDALTREFNVDMSVVFDVIDIRYMYKYYRETVNDEQYYQRILWLLDRVDSLLENPDFGRSLSLLATGLASPNMVHLNSLLSSGSPSLDICVSLGFRSAIMKLIERNTSLDQINEIVDSLARFVEQLSHRASTTNLGRLKGSYLAPISQIFRIDEPYETMRGRILELTARMEQDTELNFSPDVYDIPSIPHQLETAAEIALNQALIEFGMLFGEFSSNLSCAVTAEIIMNFHSLSEASKWALQRYLREIVRKSEFRYTRLVLQLSFDLSSMFGIRILHRMGDTPRIRQMRSIVSNLVWLSDFDETRRDSVIASQVGGSDEELNRIAHALRGYTLAKKRFEVSELITPAHFILLGVWDLSTQSLMYNEVIRVREWLSKNIDRYNDARERFAFRWAIGRDVDGLDYSVTEFAMHYPGALWRFLTNEVPILYKTHLRRLISFADNRNEGRDIKDLIQSGFRIPLRVMMFIAVLGETDLDQNLVAPFHEFMGAWIGFIQAMPLDDSISLWLRNIRKAILCLDNVRVGLKSNDIEEASQAFIDATTNLRELIAGSTTTTQEIIHS